MQEIRKENVRKSRRLLFTSEVWVWNANCYSCSLYTLGIANSLLFCQFLVIDRNAFLYGRKILFILIKMSEKYRLMKTVAGVFNTTVRQTTEMSQ